MIAVTHHHPTFLKAAYASNLKLTDHERHVPSGTNYITWDGQWRVWKMTPQRVPIPRGRFNNLGAALFAAKR